MWVHAIEHLQRRQASEEGAALNPIGHSHCSFWANFRAQKRDRVPAQLRMFRRFPGWKGVDFHVQQVCRCKAWQEDACHLEVAHHVFQFPLCVLLLLQHGFANLERCAARSCNSAHRPAIKQLWKLEANHSKRERVLSSFWHGKSTRSSRECRGSGSLALGGAA